MREEKGENGRCKQRETRKERMEGAKGSEDRGKGGMEKRGGGGVEEERMT